jgi:hypothetical protein
MPDLGTLPKMPKMMSPEQAIELFKTNAKLALERHSAPPSTDTARLRKMQFEAGRGNARVSSRSHARAVGQARRCAVADGGIAGRRARGRREIDALLG